MHGANGQGKTSLLEAIGWVATRRSRSGVCPTRALVRAGCDAGDRAGRGRSTSDATQLFEAEIRAAGRNRVQCNRQTVTRAPRPARAAAGHGVRARRPRAGEGRAADGATTSTTPRRCSRRVRRGARRLRTGAEAAQRAAARRACATTRRARTLDVFDEQLVAAGGELVRGRLRLLERLVPAVASAYASLAGDAPAGRGDVRGRVGAGAARRRPTPTRSTALLRAALARAGEPRSTGASRWSVRTATSWH